MRKIVDHGGGSFGSLITETCSTTGGKETPWR